MAATKRELGIDEFQFLNAAKLRDLTAAQAAVDSDCDLAFHFQLQEALSASLALHTSAPPPADSSVPQRPAKNVAAAELSEFELDRRRSKWGDNFQRSFGEGSSRAVEEFPEDCEFRVYFKGLVSEKEVNGKNTVSVGIGVAICDFRDKLILGIRKPVIGVGANKQVAEIRALLEGLEAALSLELKRVEIFCDYHPIFQFVRRKWQPKQQKLAMLINQVTHLQRKFEYCEPVLIARKDVKFAFKLAREAIISQVKTPGGANPSSAVKETCVICLEDTNVESFFSVDGCLHRFCYTCMKQHVEVKLLHGMLPLCPHENCKSELPVESCRKLLTPKMLQTFAQRRKEASIPVTEKVYCPYPRCSALMARNEISEYAQNAFVGSQRSGTRKCLKCHGLFCINCLVPWHSNMTCYEYKRRNPNPPAEDLKLKSLANSNLWRQCVKCHHLIELSEGCYHMTCICGYEFCYNCGAEWKTKACSCPLWDEDHILYEDDAELDDHILYEDDAELDHILYEDDAELGDHILYEDDAELSDHILYEDIAELGDYILYEDNGELREEKGDGSDDESDGWSLMTLFRSWCRCLVLNGR